jgi:hypothetical protein
MVNILPVWEQGILGTGVRVRINDDGVSHEHSEFKGRFSESDSCSSFSSIDSNHGTAVASIVGGGANNGECSVGIAPEVSLSACNILDGGTEAYLAEKVDSFDISQNSIGVPTCGGRTRRQLQTGCPFTYEDAQKGNPCSACDFAVVFSKNPVCEAAIVSHCTTHYEQDGAACLQFLDLFLHEGSGKYKQLTDVAREAITTGILEGREGKGIVYVFASGDSFQSGEDTNFEGYTNSRFVITVGAVGKDGNHASYSTPGASLFVSAPGGDYENLSNHITADLQGGCRDAGVGTSLASPVVSGVVALMLEVNPELTWRDVQAILATTSRLMGPADTDETRITNAANFTHSNLYGFGVVDGSAAVEAAKTWELYSSEKMLFEESGILDIPLLDNSSAPVTSTITLEPSTDDFFVESVEVYIALKHFSRGDLEIILTSPQGTESILHPGQRPENTILNEDERWKLLTVRSWGESARGNWTLMLRDISAGDAMECADAPFNYAVNDFVLNCEYLEKIQFCANGAITPSSVNSDQSEFLRTAQNNGRKVVDACCACGGGVSTGDFESILTQWRLVAYGREFPSDLSSSGTDVKLLASSSAPNAKPLASSSRDILPTTPIPSVSTVEPEDKVTSDSGVSQWCRWASSIMPFSTLLLLLVI